MRSSLCHTVQELDIRKVSGYISIQVPGPDGKAGSEQCRTPARNGEEAARGPCRAVSRKWSGTTRMAKLRQAGSGAKPLPSLVPLGCLLAPPEGHISNRLLDALVTEYGEAVRLTRDGDDEPENVFQTDWYKQAKAGMTPGTYMKIYRQNRKMTQAQLGALLGNLPRQHVSSMENGSRPISKKMALKLSAIFDASVERLIGVQAWSIVFTCWWIGRSGCAVADCRVQRQPDSPLAPTPLVFRLLPQGPDQTEFRGTPWTHLRLCSSLPPCKRMLVPAIPESSRQRSSPRMTSVVKGRRHHAAHEHGSRASVSSPGACCRLQQAKRGSASSPPQPRTSTFL